MGVLMKNGIQYTGGTQGFTKYSTEEQMVGEWIDGKPVYSRVIDAGENKTLTSNTWTTTTVSNTNINKIIEAKTINDTGTFWGFCGANCDSSTGYIQLIQTSNDTVNYRYILLRYTKTID